MTLCFLEAETIVFDSTIKRFSNTESDRGLFRNNASLTTFAHVDFGFDTKWNSEKEITELTGTNGGAYTPPIQGVIDLTGFTRSDNTINVEGGTKTNRDILEGASSITKVIYFNTFKDTKSKEYAGHIACEAFNGCSSLEVIELTMPLTGIDTYAFRNCEKLTVIDLKGGISDTATAIGSNAFHNCTQDITVYVYSKADLAKATAYFASVSNITVVNNSASQKAISSDGYSFRQKLGKNDKVKGPALRAEFTLINSYVEAALAEEGLRLADYGIVAFSENVLNNDFNGDFNLIIAAIQDGVDENEAKYLKFVSAKEANKYVKVTAEGLTFAAAITNIQSQNYTSNVYTYAWAAWVKDGDTENIEYTYTTYTSERTGKTAHSLYDLTVYAFRVGRANSKNTEADKLWPVLEAGALTTNQFTTHTTSASTEYTLDNGYFKYWNIDYRKYVLDPDLTGGTLKTGWGYKPDTVESDPTTGVTWSILKDGNEYILALRKKTGDAPEGVTYDYTVPSAGRNSQYSYYQPYHYKYGDVSSAGPNAKGGSMTVYSPAITQTVYNAIKTVVIDEGIVALGSDSLTGTGTITTMVVPSSLNKIESYAISNNKTLTDIIWTEDYLAKENGYKLEHLYDLRGFSSIDSNCLLSGNEAAVNVVTKNGIKVDSELAFNNAINIERYWSTESYAGYTMPDSGTLDMTDGEHGTISKGYFNAGSKITTIIVQGSLKGRHSNPFTSNEDNRTSYAYGNSKSYNFVVEGEDTNFTTSLKQFIIDLKAAPKNQTACDNLMVNGVSVKELFKDDIYATTTEPTE